MYKKEMIAMLLAGGQGSRLGVLTSKVAKPAVAFGGKYRIIDFPLSNCINSGIDTVGVLTQYQPLRLNQHIGIGIPWMDNYRIFRLGRTDNFSIDFFGQGATAQADDYEHCKCGFKDVFHCISLLKLMIFQGQVFRDMPDWVPCEWLRYSG